MRKFFEELSRRLKADGIESSNVEDRRLEIFLHGQPVLFVSPGNDVFLFPAGSNNPEASELYHRVAQTADEVYTYVEAVQTAPILHISGLSEKFHLLADFGGAVLAGRELENGWGYGQITIPFPVPDEEYDRMIELLESLEIGDALRQDCRMDELDSFYTVLNRLVGSLVNFDELDYLAKRLDSFDDGEAAQFQGIACKLGVSNIKDFINLTFCCQQATVITDFSDLDAIGRQHYMTMQGGACRIEELKRLDGRKFALDLILNHTEGRITPYGVVYTEHYRKTDRRGSISDNLLPLRWLSR